MTEVRLGRNIFTEKGKKDIVKVSKDSGANIFQIFLRSPQRYKSSRWTSYELDRLKKESIKEDMMIVVHGNFICNFCNPPGSFVHESGAKLLIEEMIDSYKIGAIGTIIHMGKKNVKINGKYITLDYNEAVDNYVKGVKKVLDKTPQKSILILETGAGQGSEICTSIQELGELYQKFSKEEQQRIKFCIDSCHIFVAGFNLSDPTNIDYLDVVVDYYLKWENVVCIHLNDSDEPCCSCKDRHGDIGRGLIKKEGLKKFIQLCIKRKIPMVLETPAFSYKDGIKYKKKEAHNGIKYTYKEQLDLIKKWIKE